MTQDPRYERRLSPQDVANQVAEILASAERDAWATIEAARRFGPFGEASPAAPVSGEGPPAPGSAADTATDELRQTIAELAGVVESLAQRLGELEQAVDKRFASGLVPAAGIVPPLAPPAQAPAPQAPAAQQNQAPAFGERAERVRAVDLALRGFTRAQIAAELRGSLPDDELERLLDEVLEAA